MSISRISRSTASVLHAGEWSPRTLADGPTPGYTPIVTADPNEVEQLVQVQAADLVLMDLALPGTDGIEVIKRILAISGVPAIFLSAYGEEEHIAGLRSGRRRLHRQTVLAN